MVAIILLTKITTQMHYYYDRNKNGSFTKYSLAKKRRLAPNRSGKKNSLFLQAYTYTKYFSQNTDLQ
jgi:hypothetical protein